MKELSLPWTKVHGVTANGVLSMIGRNTGLMGRIRQEMDREIPNFTWYFTASSTYSHHVEKL